MPDAYVAPEGIQAEALIQNAEFALLFSDEKLAVENARDPGRVVTTILQPYQPHQKNGINVLGTDIAYNSTHEDRAPP